MKRIAVALVGLSFGMEFLPIYQRHPGVSRIVAVDLNPKLLKVAHERYHLPSEDLTTSYQRVLDDPSIDAIHLVTPPATHAPFSIMALEAGKHCGCTIPMGLSIDELYSVIEARKKSGKRYMFMETTIYQRESLYLRELYRSGKFGRLQYMSCAHYQDMEGWPDYWKGFPPLMHPTHAIAPCLMMLEKFPKYVYGRGSGRVREELRRQYDCPFAFESALVELEDSDVTIEMERFLYGVARSYSECFRIYGENMSFEWQQLEGEGPVLYRRTGNLSHDDTYDMDDDPQRFSRGSEITEERITVPDYAHLLPDEIADFTRKTVYNKENQHLSFAQGGGHGGSHPHLVHEFVSAIREDRNPVMDDTLGAYWTGTGICAHHSAIQGGVRMEIPDFRKPRKS